MREKEIHTLDRSRLYERIADQLETRIIEDKDEEWQEGAKLPSEQKLAESFGVSRNMVREAIKLLKERGLAEPKTVWGCISPIRTRNSWLLLSIGMYC